MEADRMVQSLPAKSLVAIKAFLTRRLTIECDRIPYTYQRVGMKRLVNWLLTETSVYAKPPTPWGWPTILQVEPSSVCNLRCTFCPVTTGLERPAGLLDFEIYKRVIDEIGDYLFLILLWDWGEPFLNPAIYDMIAYAKARKIRLVSSTNGHVFAGGDHAERLVNSGIDSIIFAVDGLDQKTYRQYRARGEIDTVLSGIKRVVAAKRALGSETPLVNLRFLAMRHNEHQVPLLQDFALELGVDAVSIKTLNPFDQGECHSTKADGLEFIPRDPHLQRFEFDPVTGMRIRHRHNPCRKLWNDAVLASDGTVSPCEFDPHNRYVVGDLTHQSFKEIWSGAPMARLRRQFRRDDQKMGLCAGCTNAYVGGQCSTETIAEVCFLNAQVEGGV